MRFRTHSCDRTTWLLVAALACAPLGASAQSADESIQITWRDAAGPVVGYDVYVSINGSAMGPSFFTPDSEVEISGEEYQRGDALRIQVVAVAVDGRRGLPSELSDIIFFSGPPPPQDVIAVNGSLVSPNAIYWDPVAGIDFYVVFRSEDPSEVGTLLAPAYAPNVEDFEAEPGLTYHYSIAAIKGRQVSEFSTAVAARRSVDTPELAASPASLSYTAMANQTTASQTLELSNSGGLPLSYTAWPTAPWLQVTPSGATVDDGGELLLQLTYALDSLTPGQHNADVLLYTYYQPSPGEELVSGPVLVIPISVTVPAPNSVPVITAPPPSGWVVVSEGDVAVVPFLAMDPDPGEGVSISVTGLPSFATFQDFGGGLGEITLAPDHASAGLYQSELTASNAAGQTSQNLTVLVRNVNLGPVVAVIPDTTIEVGEQSWIFFEALDPDGDRIAISASALPDFATLTDFGNGMAKFGFGPTADDVGTYLIVVGVVDDGSPSGVATTFFTLTVE
jgi:hypothetical protein